jgi:glutaredoxin
MDATDYLCCAAVAGFIILIVVLIRSKPGVYHSDTPVIVRYSRPTCRYCIESQGAWNGFVKTAQAHNLRIDIVEVNLSEDSEHTRKWAERYPVQSVPTVVKFGPENPVEYNGPRTTKAYLSFAI